MKKFYCYCKKDFCEKNEDCSDCNFFDNSGGEFRDITTTNADRIRAMSDEEMADFVCFNAINTLCDIICDGDCNAVATIKKSGDEACKEIVMKWLQQPVEDANHDKR